MPWKERYVVEQANRARFSVGVRQPETSIALGSRQRRIAVAQAGEQRDPGRETAGIGECRFIHITSWVGDVSLTFGCGQKC